VKPAAVIVRELAEGARRILGALYVACSWGDRASTTTTTFVIPTQPIAAILPPEQTVQVGQTVTLDAS